MGNLCNQWFTLEVLRVSVPTAVRRVEKIGKSGMVVRNSGRRLYNNENEIKERYETRCTAYGRKVMAAYMPGTVACLALCCFDTQPRTVPLPPPWALRHASTRRMVKKWQI